MIQLTNASDPKVNFYLQSNSAIALTLSQMTNFRLFNPLPDSKILALSKLKAFADNNFSVAQVV